MKTLIEKRIADLKKEKEELLKEYPDTSADMQDVLAERNMRISLELKFLNELSQACVMLSLPEREGAIKAFIEIQKYQMNYVQLARTTELYKIAQNALIALGHDGNGA